MLDEITMNQVMLLDLIEHRGFTIDLNNELHYTSGNTTNYKRIRICQPHQYGSIKYGSDVSACFVKYEARMESGYLECDWKISEEGYVAVDDLFKYLDSKGLYSKSGKRHTSKN